MFLKKSDRDPAADDTTLHPVTVEPLPGHTDEEICTRLAEYGGIQIKVLAPGFISARATRASLRRLEEIANIAIKPAKQLRF